MGGRVKTLQELIEEKAFQTASDEEVQKVSQALDSIRPEAAQEIVSLLSVPAPRRSVGAAALAGALAISTALLGALYLKSLPSVWPKREPASSSAVSQPLFRPLTREELNHRIERAIASTLHNRVIYEDILGEGSGAWDPSPRYPSGIVNCILWVDLVLSEAYGMDLADKTPIMDKIRYYRGQPAFGLRKHFLPHRLGIEPAPLRPLPLGQYITQVLQEPVAHDFNHFREGHKYTCPFFKMSQSAFLVDYVSPADTVKIAQQLAPGYYFLFGVATERYQKTYGAKSGPMGLVHGLILEVPQKASSEGPAVYHASTQSKRVMRQPLDEYVAKMGRALHKGYAIYEADPAWNYTIADPPEAEALAIQKCEKELSARGERRTESLR